MSERLNRYRVHLHSKPSPGRTFYDGHVDVFAEDEADARVRAIGELRRGAFRDYAADAWKIDNVERLST